MVTHSEAETVAFGRVLGRDLGLEPGAVVLLEGPLGAGKTALIRGLAAALDADAQAVTSPTFTLVQTYVGRMPLQHVDLYRLSPAEVDELGLDEIGEGGVLAIEWAERWRNPPSEVVRIRLEILPDGRRIVVDDARSAGRAAGYSTR